MTTERAEGILKKDLIEIRKGKPEDFNLIYATWLKGLLYGNEWFQQIDREAYYKHYHDVIEIVLNRPQTEISIACLKEDPDTILGYSIWERRDEKNILHWVWVKPVWRKIGIGHDLMPMPVHVVTHLTRTILQKKEKHILFNPFII